MQDINKHYAPRDLHSTTSNSTKSPAKKAKTTPNDDEKNDWVLTTFWSASGLKRPALTPAPAPAPAPATTTAATAPAPGPMRPEPAPATAPALKRPAPAPATAATATATGSKRPAPKPALAPAPKAPASAPAATATALGTVPAVFPQLYPNHVMEEIKIRFDVENSKSISNNCLTQMDQKSIDKFCSVVWSTTTTIRVKFFKSYVLFNQK